MPPRNRATSAPVEPSHVEQSQLAESVDRLSREIQAMRDELDEARAEIAWAMRTSLAERSGGNMPPLMQPDLEWEPRPMLGERSLLGGEAGEQELVESVMRGTSEGDPHSPEPRPQADLPTARRAEFNQWCREVRDPAILHSEGRRTICTARDEARLEYEIAPLPGGGWAVNWQYGFLGNRGGASQAWTQLASREDCLSRVISAAKAFFAVRPDDASHQAACREMQRRLTGGLFGFIEPEPVRDRPPRPTE